jgi:head-tail adaptor
MTMAFKNVNPGDLRTQVILEDVKKTLDGAGNYTEEWTNVFGAGVTVGCRWVNAHGTESDENNRLKLGEKATLTMRYSSLITATCRIKKGAEIWEVESLDNINECGSWLEIKVKRTGAAI